jgi:hypothetical protein
MLAVSKLKPDAVAETLCRALLEADAQLSETTARG